MRWLIRSLLVAVLAVASVHAITDSLDPDNGLSTTEIIQRRGYAVESHDVVTDDRYVLTMHRIPKSYDETQAKTAAAPNKPAIFLMHGLLDSSFTFVLNFRTQSLAYLLADAGYDVWMGNNRGNVWSRKHLDFTTDDDRFWDYSWEEMGRYDLPAMLKYVLSTTGRETLSFVGHSEGSMLAFAGFALDQELAKKVSYFAAMGPVAYLGDMASPVFNTLAASYADKLFQFMGVGEFLPQTPIIQDVIGRYGCAVADCACDSFINALMGPSENVNTTRFQVYVSKFPSGTSVKNLAHFAQGIRKDTFKMYDYGCKCLPLVPVELCSTLLCENKRVYGTKEAPDFDLSLMKYPRTALFTGTDDWLATPKDVAKLRKALPKGTIIAEKTVDYNHLDFSLAFNAADKIYGDLIEQVKANEGKGY